MKTLLILKPAVPHTHTAALKRTLVEWYTLRAAGPVAGARQTHLYTELQPPNPRPSPAARAMSTPPPPSALLCHPTTSPLTTGLTH